METYALFRGGVASRLVFDSFDTSPQDDPVRLVFPDIDDLQVRNSARNGCLAAYHVLQNLGYLRRTSRFFYTCQFTPPNLNPQVQGSSAGLAFCLKFVQEYHRQNRGTPLPCSVAATGVISDATHSATVDPVLEINPKLEVALAHLQSGDLVIYPAGNQDQVDPGLQEEGLRRGIRLVPVSRVAQAIAAVLPQPEAQMRRRRTGLVAALTLLLAGAGGPAYYYHSAEESPQPAAASFSPGEGADWASPPPQPDLAARLQGVSGLRLAADLHYLGLVGQGRLPLELPAGNPLTLRYGDLFKLACQSNQACFLHIYQIDQHGRVDRLPDPIPEADLPRLEPNTTYYFPPALEDWRQVDTVEGRETLYFVATPAPDEDLERLYRQVRQAPEERKRNYSHQLQAALQARVDRPSTGTFAFSFPFFHGPFEPRTTAMPGPELCLRGEESGQIIYSSSRFGESDIYRINTDGNAISNLTERPSNDYCPRWSPDHQLVAFISERENNPEICVMNASGSRWHYLTHDPGRDTNPSWSPDGTQLVFQSNRDNADEQNYDLYVMNADGSQVRALASSSYREHSPSWSPDGQWIAYVRSTTFDDQEIFLTRPDGSGKRPFRLSTLPLNTVNPAWSPDGKRLAFVGIIPGAPTTLLIGDLDGITLKHVPAPASALSPSFSPDGTHLVFVAHPQAPSQSSYRVYTCDIRGRELRQLTASQQMDMSPSWSEGFRSFGGASLGEQVGQKWYVDNPGSDTLRVTQVRFSDTQFAVEPGQFAVAPGEVQTVRLTFSPAREGTHYTMLTFLSNDPDDPEIQLILNGRGLPAHMAQSGAGAAATTSF